APAASRVRSRSARAPPRRSSSLPPGCSAPRCRCPLTALTRPSAASRLLSSGCPPVRRGPGRSCCSPAVPASRLCQPSMRSSRRSPTKRRYAALNWWRSTNVAPASRRGCSARKPTHRSKEDPRPTSARAARHSGPHARSIRARNRWKTSTRCARRSAARRCRCSPSPTEDASQECMRASTRRAWRAWCSIRPARSPDATRSRALVYARCGEYSTKASAAPAPAAIAAAAHGNAVQLARLTSSLAAEGPGSQLTEATAPATSLPPGPLGAESLKAQAPPSDSIVSLALFAATYCDESELPWSADSPPEGRAGALRGWLATQPAQAFAPFAASTVVAGSALQLCMDWPATPPAPPSPTGVSAVPTLLLSGDDDLRTPYEQTLPVAAGYGDGQLLRVPDTGHSTVTADLTGCARRAMIEFLTAGQAPASCPGSSEP